MFIIPIKAAINQWFYILDSIYSIVGNKLIFDLLSMVNYRNEENEYISIYFWKFKKNLV